MNPLPSSEGAGRHSAWTAALAIACATMVATAVAAQPVGPAAAADVAPRTGLATPDAAEAAVSKRLQDADTVFMAGEHRQALAMMAENLALALQTLGPSHVLTFNARIDHAGTLYHLGELARARPLMEATLQDCVAALGEGHPQCLDALNNLANMTEEAQGIHAALPLYERAYRLRLAYQGAEHEHSISALSDLAFGLMQSGELHRALPLMQQALDLRRRVQGETHPYTFTAANNLAVLYERLGRLTDARRAQEAVLALRLKHLGERHPETLVSMNNLARVLNALGDRAAARALSVRTLALMQAVLGGRHFKTLDAVQNLADDRAGDAAWAQARAGYEEVIDIRAQVQSEDHPRRLQALVGLAGVLRMQDQPAQALARLDQARAGIARTVGDRHPLAVQERAERARLLLRGQQPAAAQLAADDALAAAVALFGPLHETVEDLRALRVVAVLRNGQADQARLAVDALVRDLEQARQRWLPNDAAARQRWQQRHQRVYQLAMRLHLATGQVGPAFGLLQQMRARNLRDTLDDRQLALAAGVPLDDWRRLQERREAVQALGNLLTRDQGPAARQALLAARAAAMQACDALADTLVQQYPAYARAEVAQPPRSGTLASSSLGVAANAADRETAEISFVLMQPDALLADTGAARLGAFAKRSGHPLQWVDLGPADGLTDTVQTFRTWTAHLGQRPVDADNRPIRILRTVAADGQPRWQRDTSALQPCADGPCKPQPGHVVWGDSAWRDLATALGHRLLAPLAGAMGGASRLLISPDPLLAALPWDALVLHGRHLVQGHAVQLAQSTGTAALPRPAAVAARTSAGPARPASLWAIGNPAFDADSQAAGPGVADGALVRGRLRVADLPAPALDADGRLTFGAARWPQLTAAGGELAASAAAFRQHGARATVLSGPMATESALRAASRSGALAEARVLLFSTHAFFNPDIPRHSALVLTRGGAGADDDGYLTPDELVGLRLDADLTVLSACETAQGASTDADAAAGFAYALQVAGSRKNVLTLWPVSDAATARFTALLMAGIASGQDADQALQATKRHFLHHPHARWRSARHWAAFALYGH